jgi:hypothetical protein
MTKQDKLDLIWVNVFTHEWIKQRNDPNRWDPKSLAVIEADSAVYDAGTHFDEIEKKNREYNEE